MPGATDHNERDFALRAAAYLSEQGLTEDEVRQALVIELGMPAPEADALVADALAA